MNPISSATASLVARVTFRLTFAVLLLVAFYVGRPLYWNFFVTIHDIRVKEEDSPTRSIFCHSFLSFFGRVLDFDLIVFLRSVILGISQFVIDAQKSGGGSTTTRILKTIDDRAQGKATARGFLSKWLIFVCLCFLMRLSWLLKAYYLLINLLIAIKSTNKPL